jgi:uncharacterized protein
MAEEKKLFDRFCWAMVSHRFWVMTVVIVGVSIFTMGAGNIKTEVILQHLFPYDHPYLKLNARFAQIFGGGGFGVAIAVKEKQGNIFKEKTLKKIKAITDELILWDEVYRVLTVSIATNSTKVVKAKSKGEIAIEALMFPDVPKTPEEMELLKNHIFSNPAYSGILVSNDGTAALIMTQLKETVGYDKAFTLLRKLSEEHTDNETTVHIVGYPMLMGWIYSYKTQMYWVFGISVLMMILILYAVFRNFVGMVAPIVMAMICTCLGLGFIGWTRINFSPLLFVLAFLVGARMISNAVQITERYIDEYHADGESLQPRRDAAYKTMRGMMMPNAAAVATDVAGFLVLGLAKIVLMQQVAILMSFWMLTIVLSGVLVPIICCCLPRLGRKNELNGPGGLNRMTAGIAAFSMGRGKYLIGMVTVIVVIGGVWQTSRLKVGDPTPGTPILWPDHPYNQAQALINNTFNASSENFMLYYEGEPGSVYDPVVPKTFEAFSRHMASSLPDIYKSSSSINSLGKMLSLTLHDGNELWYQMPRDPEQLEGLLGYVRNNIDSGTLRRFIDGKLQCAQITLFFSDHTSDNMLRIRDAAYDFFKNNPMKTERGEFKLAGGAIGLEIAVNEEMQESHATMDSLVLLAIFLMCTIAFRSFVAGAMLTLPLLVSNFVAFAYMSLNHIGLSTNTLPCSAVGVGVGVDFSIYLYSRCMEEYSRHNGLEETVLTAVRTAGRGIVFTGLTMILPILTWYFISALKFQAQMGFFLAMLLCTNMIMSFTLHPLLIILIKPKFMKRKEVN